MSWNWERLDEEKKYPAEGMVTISTEEYRDLISKISRLRELGQKEHDDWNTERRKAESLEERVRNLERKLAEINEWFDDCEGKRTEFKLWKVERLEKKEADNE